MATPQDRQREQRARGRRNWPIRRFRQGQEPGDDLSASTTAEERLAMMWPLAREAWTLMGGVPDYPRAQAPGRVVRGRGRGS